AARVCIRAEEEPRDDQERRERKACYNMEDVRPQRVNACASDAGPRPRYAQCDGRDRKPPPHSQASKNKCRARYDRKINVERPVIRTLGDNEKRRNIGPDQAKARERRSMQ